MVKYHKKISQINNNLFFLNKKNNYKKNNNNLLVFIPFIYAFILYLLSFIINSIYLYVIKKKINRQKKKNLINCEYLEVFISGKENYNNNNIYNFGKIRIRNNDVNGYGFEYINNFKYKFILNGFASKTSKNIIYLYYKKQYLNKKNNEIYYFIEYNKEIKNNNINGKLYYKNLFSWNIHNLEDYNMGNLDDIEVYNTTIDNKCIICITEDICLKPIFFCGHVGLCSDCNLKLEECPFCKNDIFINY